VVGRNSGGTVGSCLLTGLLASVAVCLIPAGVRADTGTTVADLSGLSIEELANLPVTSVSKVAQPLSDAAAAIFVITHDDIMHSGAQSLPEILRLAPNLQVAQMSANNYVITARGFNGNDADKLLVLIDGRTIYSPLFGGVYWYEQEILPENIERIEIISGPGATLWGANAVNGVINIITRKSGATQGGVLDLSAGNRGGQGSLQYGGTLESDLAYRVYMDSSTTPSDKTSTGANAEDGWTKTQGGFRLDWTPQNDTVSLQGDLYHGDLDAVAAPAIGISGSNLQVTWQHPLGDGAALQVLAYYDGTRQFEGIDGGYTLNTYDLEVQHSFSPWEGHNIVWGAGYRLFQDDMGLWGRCNMSRPRAWNRFPTSSHRTRLRSIRR
jgi:iron complex outermembrane receptor protein